MGDDGDPMAHRCPWNADFLVNMSASADVLAQAKVEIDLAAIPEGKNVCLHPLLLSLSSTKVDGVLNSWKT